MAGVVISTWEQDESGNQPLYPHGCSRKGKRKQTVEIELTLSQILFLSLLETSLQRNRLFSPRLSAFQHEFGNLLSTPG